MPISKDYQTVICHIENSGKLTKGVRVLMVPITYFQESQLDRGFTIKYKSKDFTFEIGKHNLVCYGEVDFHTNSEDYENIRELINFNDIVHLPANYDYDTHTCKTDVNMYKTYESTDVAAMTQYAHGRLGKPERVAIFKIYI